MKRKSNPQDILRSLITNQEQLILAEFQQDKRWALLELARSNDGYFWYTLSPASRSAELQEINRHLQFYYQYGWTKSLSLFMGNHCQGKGVPLTPSTLESQKWGESTISLCGKLGLCELLLDYHRFGLGELSVQGNNEIHFKFTGQYAGVEALEREEFDFLSDLALEMDSDKMSKLFSIRTEIISRMSELVQPWRTYYIQYDTEPEIDTYYQHFGLSWSRANCLGADCFPNEAIFGGLSFGLYKAAIVNLVGFAWKHFDFCQALLLKRPDMNLLNILTMYCHRDDLCAEIAAALDIPYQEALNILSLLTLTPQNKTSHVLIPRNYSPPFIQISEEAVIYSISGLLSNSPFLFLLTELRHKFPNDWDRAVDAREEVFRNELYKLFPDKPFLKINRSVKIKGAGKVITDIDAIILDTRTGTLCLFQLKWQDFFGSSMQKRETKKANLLKTANSWIDIVSKWLKKTDKQSINQMLGTNRFEVKRVYLFVMGRNFAHFSGDSKPDKRAVWCMWPQFFRLVKEGLDQQTFNDDDPLQWLYKELQNESPINKSIVFAGQEFQLGDYRIVLEAFS